MRKRIGSTSYEVGAHFNLDSRETPDDKILRLALNKGAGESEKNNFTEKAANNSRQWYHVLTASGPAAWKGFSQTP
jgi:hypothetical protein